MCQSNTTKLYYVYYCIRATCFDVSSSGSSKKINPYLKCLKLRCGIPNAYNPTRPEDDSIRIETCCLNTIIK